LLFKDIIYQIGLPPGNGVINVVQVGGYEKEKPGENKTGFSDKN